MKSNNRDRDRIPFRVESPRGDDKLGINTITGEIISDFEAGKQGVPFRPDIPKDQIQKAVETQLNNDRWVCIEKKDGSTELLTKKDVPKEPDGLLRQSGIIDTTPKAPVTVPKAEPPEEAAKPADELKDAAKQADEQPKEPTKPASEGQKESTKPEGDDWKDVFNVVRQSGSKPAAVNQTCTEKPKKPKEEWESKFENIKSATATHKGKGG
ncbi:hypothetical protein FLAV_01944 [Flavobacteriales bacterium]|nr:hypothetical protein FLAV_01944 [Flavobacteriales bacterium]